MQPLFDDDEKQCMYDDTMHIVAGGTVASVSKESCSFVVFGTQFVCGQQEEITIRGHTNKNPKWKNPAAVLPRAKAIINFDGFLDRFEGYTPQNRTAPITCAVVAVQNIYFLQPAPTTAAPVPGKDIRTRVQSHKWKRGNTTVPSQTTPPVLSQTSKEASSSHTLLDDDERNVSENEGNSDDDAHV